MKISKDKQSLIIVGLTVVILCMTIGFAAYAQVLNINGKINVKGNKWSVRFVPESYTRLTGSVVEDNVTPSTTTLTYEVTLEKPGDYYNYYIDIINDGTLRAQLNSVTTTTLSTEQQKYLSIEMVYNPNKNSSDTENLGNGNKTFTNAPLLDINQEARLTVKVSYKADTAAEDLPEQEQTISLVTSLNYAQAE